MVRVNLSLPIGLVEMADKAAEEDFTSRSDIIRAALLWYLRPQGRGFEDTDADALLKTLQRRKMLREINESLQELDERA